MGVTIHNIAVGTGDCLLITSDICNILVDCGRYNNAVKRVLSENGIETLDLIIATHIDNDHIGGLINLIKEKTVTQILFNGFHHIPLENISNKQHEISDEKYKCLKNYQSYFSLHTHNEDKVDAKQSLSLSEEIRKRNIPWNSIIDEERLSVDYKKEITIENVKITLLSPNDSQLRETYNEYRKFIYEKLGYLLEKDKKEDVFRSLYDLTQTKNIVQSDEYSISAYTTLSKSLISKYSREDLNTDTSISNKASLAFIIEIEDKKILILGDAHPDTIYESLNKIERDKPIIFDAIKVSHHGSNKNTTNKLLSLIDSPIYIFCGGNNTDKPSEYTISKIINRPISEGCRFEKRSLYFNRDNKLICKFNNTDSLQNEFSFSIETDNTSVSL